MSRQRLVKEHFEEIAHKYDFYKEQAWYYYDWLKKVIKMHISSSETKSILEVGCGTGDVLAYLNPKQGLGTDISKKMINIAKEKHPELKFKVEAAESMQTGRKWDYILLADVIEHLGDVEDTFQSLSQSAGPETTIIITMINPIWEPILLAGEKLGKKMPEGPHHRISFRSIKRLAAKTGMRITKRGFYVFVPVHIPVVSEAINTMFHKLPLIRRFGLIEILELKVI